LIKQQPSKRDGAYRVENETPSIIPNKKGTLTGSLDASCDEDEKIVKEED
jgi:hypothetical protein